MAKRKSRPATIPHAKKKPKALPQSKHQCERSGCKGLTVYMKMNRKTKKMDYWCAPHWKSDVEGKNPERYKGAPKPPPNPKAKKRVVKKKVKK